MKCPKCGIKLYRGDVTVVSEYLFEILDDLTTGDIEKMSKEELNEKIKVKLVKKEALCEKCGCVLGRREFDGGERT